MSFCNKCNVSIRGAERRCPLCQGELEQKENAPVRIFPAMKQELPAQGFIRWMLFASIIVGVAAVITNISNPAGGYWSVFVLGGLASLWISFAIVVKKRHNIHKTTVWQVFIVSALAILWDVGTSWHGWSIDYVFPIICALTMIAMAILAQILKLKIQDYLIYLVIDALFGLVPLVLVLCNVVSVIYPSLICIGVSVLSLIALLIFEGEAMRSEIVRRFHL